MRYSRQPSPPALAVLCLSMIALTSLASPRHRGVQGQAFTYTSYGTPVEIEPGLWVSPGAVQLPVTASFTVLSAHTGREVTRVTTAPNGVFAAPLRPGAYVLVADSLAGSFDCYVPPGPIAFTVRPKGFTVANLFYFHQGPCSIVEASTSPRLAASAPAYRADRILIQPKPEISLAALARFHAALKSEVLQTFEGIGRLQVLRVPEGETVQSLIARYQQSGLVEFAEPDFIRSAAAAPNDPKYLDGTLWGLNNTGQNGGTADADIDAPEAWDVLSSASNIVVAVLDTGVRYTHEDLAPNMWVNSSDGGHGFNALADTNDPNDDNGHGTLMAGILGGVGDNGKGVTGVAWRVQIMALKCLDNAGRGSDAGIIAGIDYARTNGARIINASLDSPAYSQSLSNAIVAVRDAGIIFVASCGNGPPAVDVDANPRYPACYDIENVVSVAYTTRNDTLGFLSNYGATNVDLAAPGDQIYSTYAGSDTSYYPPSFLNVAGTSYAAAYVTGACALLLAEYPSENYQRTIARVLNATDPLPSLAGKCVTGGRLNLRRALSPPIGLAPLSSAGGGPFQLRVSADPGRTCVIEVTTNLTSWSPFFTNTTSANGTFDFTDHQSTNSPRRFFRAVSAP